MDRLTISKGELAVSRALWSLGSGTVREVHEALSTEREMDFATVQTYLRRLEAKGYVQSRRDGRLCVYSPRVRPRTVIREAVGEICDLLFGGNAFPLVQHLIADRGLTAADVKQLRELLDQWEAESGSTDSGSGGT